ncbi:hypothetical protein BsWGS_00819 [Bradybaena similaris]
MEMNRRKRQSLSSRSSTEREYSRNKFERSVKRRQSSASSYSRSPIKSGQLVGHQRSISPSRNQKISSKKSRKLFSSTGNEGCSSSSRRKCSLPLSWDISAFKKDCNISPESCKREWLPSSSKKEDNPNFGHIKTRFTRCDSSSSDFDTPVKKHAKSKQRKESLSPEGRTRSPLSENKGHISKKTKRSFACKNEPKEHTLVCKTEPKQHSFTYKNEPDSTSEASTTSPSSKENSPSSSLSDTYSPISDEEPNYETPLSIQTSRRQLSSVSVKDSHSTSKHSGQLTHKGQSTQANQNSRSFSISMRGRTHKVNKASSNEKCSVVYKHKSHSISPPDTDHSYRGRTDTDGSSYASSKRIIKFKDGSLKRQRKSSLTPKDSKRDTEIMQIQVIVKRRRSSESTSVNNTTNEFNDYENLEHSRKRRRLNAFDNGTKVRSVAIVPKPAPQNIRRDVNLIENYEFVNGSHNSSNKRRSFHDTLLLQNCCPHSDEHGSDFRDQSSGSDARFYSPNSGKNSSGSPFSGHLDASPHFTTPKRSSNQHYEGSPKFSSPSYITNMSPRSTLKGLDQPHSWAVDLLARSETYRGKFIDSHCHIDLLYDRLGLSHGTRFSEFQRMVANSFPSNFEGCVAVFCYPKAYDPNTPQDQLFNTLAKDDDIWFAIGCHPKSATEFTARHEHGLRKALEQSRVVALGEIGLDYSGTFHRHAETQKTVLRKQLQMAIEMKLPLVIHCRDAYDDCLTILMEMVPRSWPIHLHCFCGNSETANIWLKTFPNLYIGLTPVITFRTAHDAINTARNIPLSRLLLETDSPYFVPGNIPKGRSSVSHPGFALFTAERIAELKNVSVDTVLKACRVNTYNMYGI